MVMHIFRPPGLQGGFHAQGPDPACPALTHCGENWWPQRRRIGRHDHPVWEFYLQLDGVSRWRIAGADPVTVGSEALLLVPPGCDHAMEPDSAAGHHFVFAGLDVAALSRDLPALAEPWQGLGWRVIEGAGSLRTPFVQLLDEVTVDRPWRSNGLDLALRYLLLATTRLLGSQPARAYLILHRGVEEARRLLDDQPGRRWQLAELAAAVHLSPQHLSTLFHRQLGQPPHRYLLGRRIGRARELIARSDLSMSEVARRCGFSSSQHLARAVKRATGMSLSVWRQTDTER